VPVGAQEGEHPAHALVGVDLVDLTYAVGRHFQLLGELPHFLVGRGVPAQGRAGAPTALMLRPRWPQ
jgi:hypothetical protein